MKKHIAIGLAALVLSALGATTASAGLVSPPQAPQPHSETCHGEDDCLALKRKCKKKIGYIFEQIWTKEADGSITTSGVCFHGGPK